MKRDILFCVILCILSSSSLLCFLSFGTICTFLQPQVNFYFIRRERRFYFLAHIRGKVVGGGEVHRRFGLESTTVFCKNTLAVQSGLFTCPAGKGTDFNSLKEANIAVGPQFNSDFTKLKHLMRIICFFFRVNQSVIQGRCTLNTSAIYITHFPKCVSNRIEAKIILCLIPRYLLLYGEKFTMFTQYEKAYKFTHNFLP